MYIKLSNNINKNDPGWPDSPKFEYTPLLEISKGDVANTGIISIFNHFGTHIDAPKHYNDDGLRVAELPLDTFIYETPLLLRIPKSYYEFITPDDLKPFYNELKKADLLMVYSGFNQKRKEDPEGYSRKGPAFGADAAKYVMDNFNLKAVAVDWISFASFDFPEDGTLAHQYMFGKFHDHYTCVIEDACFDMILDKRIIRVYALPLLVEGVDSSQVTIIAEVE